MYLPSSLVQSFILVFSVPSFIQINDEALQLIGANCPNLITLNVHGCKVGEIGGGVEGGEERRGKGARGKLKGGREEEREEGEEKKEEGRAKKGRKREREEGGEGNWEERRGGIGMGRSGRAGISKERTRGRNRRVEGRQRKDH